MFVYFLATSNNVIPVSVYICYLLIWIAYTVLELNKYSKLPSTKKKKKKGLSFYFYFWDFSRLGWCLLGFFFQHKLHSSMISRCILFLSENSKKSSKQTKKINFSYLVKYNQWNNVVFNPASVEKIFQCVVFKQFRAVVVFLLKITQWIRYVKDSISYSYVISGFKPVVVPTWIICHGQNSRDIQNHSRLFH